MPEYYGVDLTGMIFDIEVMRLKLDNIKMNPDNRDPIIEAKSELKRSQRKLKRILDTTQ